MEDSRYKLDFKKNLAPDFALTYDTIVACSAKKFTLFSAIMSNTLLLPYEYRHFREDYRRGYQYNSGIVASNILTRGQL